MHGSFDRQLIFDKDFELVSFLGFHQRPRLLAVDEIHLASDAICDRPLVLRQKLWLENSMCV